ncbi:GTP-binding protein Obg/CgtA [Pyrenophora tritici-repentis]|uniref:GTP-binding protein Obg/CgtA n=3 Tax=Pyrenophora tritici-repentis TaxID=45151 RepID=A0A2W1EXL6_9PLEO|nr:GTP-binding protein Obg/CgtA [Pyrenophora tritici-repentis]KAI0589663.1 GTP-binding protein Obg/CgtA [Pyrenophora tritici-repentis]KAI0625327.1 GTP-binding protein Obg/CgtA [Pyrenophora tritici-repentis]KAI1518394.1 GTP-binding protein Obg/CgtA [Pyrenophora tritici-repentis]KAI1543953.1 Obg GTPase [Pyrenophora tritici-repentis]
MSFARSYCLSGTLTPFLYPAFLPRPLVAVARRCPLHNRFPPPFRCASTTAEQSEAPPNAQASRLDPEPDDYSLTPFADRCILTVEAGAGGHGCVSFLREKYIEEGPANGGDGGSGGNVYIQAIRGETSLHKLARRRQIKAGRGRNGQGKVKGGERGTDVLITVPVGTIVRELQRHDPIAIMEKEHWKMEQEVGEEELEEGTPSYRKDRWLVYPGTIPSELSRMKFPKLPPPRRSHLAALEPEAPMWLDLDKHMETPMLIAAGAMGGLGNPHFMTPYNSRPKIATRGDEGLKISLQLELKILADLGLVGLPNAGKSTLLRALSNSRARVGNWAFTTLQPNVGTVVLDNHKGRPLVTSRRPNGELRENFTVADVPGLIEDAHLDKGLGLGFLRHIERAAVLAFVIDLSAGDAVAALKLLWREVSEYETLRGKELNAETERRMVTYRPPGRSPPPSDPSDVLDSPHLDPSPKPLPFLTTTPISSKPWFVVATKADLPDTQANFEALLQYLGEVSKGTQAHPSNRKHAWKQNVQAVPISAIQGEGVQVIPQLVMDLLDE